MSMCQVRQYAPKWQKVRPRLSALNDKISSVPSNERKYAHKRKHDAIQWEALGETVYQRKAYSIRLPEVIKRVIRKFQVWEVQSRNNLHRHQLRQQVVSLSIDTS